MAAQQGIQLPVSLQLTNLQDIVNQLKQFSGKNILSNSLGGKKIDKELLQVINRLEQISAKSKTALTSQSNFSSIQRDIDAIEIGFNKIQDVIKSISFEDLKLPNDVQAQVDGLNSRIKELQNSLISFKGTQKEKLLNNDAFKANLSTAMGGPAQAAKEMEKGYDQLYQSINNGLTKVNRVLGIRIAEFKDAQNAFTQSSANKTMMTQWGAVDFLKEAFSSLPKDKSKKSDTQKLLSEVMEYKNLDVSGFKNKGLGYNKFMDLIQERFLLSDSQMADFQNKIREQAKALKKTQTEILRDISQDSTKAASFLFGSQKNTIQQGALKYNPQQYDNDKRTYETAKRDLQKTQEEKVAYSALRSSFGDTNKAVEAEASRIAQALKLPQQELANLKQRAIEAAQANPQLVNAFNGASQAVNQMGVEIQNGEARLAKMNQTLGKMQGVQNFINRYIGVYAIVRKVTQFLRNAIENIKELDKSITNIAIVTNMSQQDLWGKVGQYTQMAQQYGVATKDVYNVSQLFYQQGLQTNQVMALTTETLKMAKVSGMDYTEATNAMTVAIRAFSIEMDNAQQVTDTYSALAAKFAVSSAEIANAMEKTASSAANVGMSLQSTSAFISVMEQTTREGAQNIGSALKSIISRYGEMKASPNEMLNIDGEEVAFNKVDTALKSIGISIKDSAGQFRNFDDVIMELSAKWDSLDNNTQRYVATVMAGNRQQSRFIALVSNYDELKRAMNTANNAENASVVQTAKAMDSLESKANQLKNAFSQLYLDLHVEDSLKGMYDWLTKIVTLIGKLGTLKGVLPTLFSVVNAGFGARGLINMGKDWYQDRIGQQKESIDKLKLDKSEAEKSLNEFIQQVEQPREMPIKTRVDTSELPIDVQNASSMFGGTLNSIAPSIDNTGSAEEIKTQVISSLSNIEGIKGQIEAIGSEVAQSLVVGMLNSIGITGPAAERLGQSILEGIQNSLDIHSPSPLIIAMLETGVGGAAVQAMIQAAKEAGASSAEIGNQILQNLAQSINNGNISFEGLTEQLKTGLDNFAREASTYSHDQLRDMFGQDTFRAIQVTSYRTQAEELSAQWREAHGQWERTTDSEQSAYLQAQMDEIRAQENNLTIDNAPILPSAIKDVGLTQLYDMLGGGLKRNYKDFRNIIRDRDLTGKIQSQYGDKWTDATVVSTAETQQKEAEAEAARKAKEEADRKVREEEERKAKEEADRKAREEAERKAQEEARYKAEQERLSREAMARVTANDRPSTAGTSSMDTIMNAVRNTPTVGPRDYDQFVGTVAPSRTPNVQTSSLADLQAAVAQETAREAAEKAQQVVQEHPIEIETHTKTENVEPEVEAAVEKVENEEKIEVPVETVPTTSNGPTLSPDNQQAGQLRFDTSEGGNLNNLQVVPLDNGQPKTPEITPVEPEQNPDQVTIDDVLRISADTTEAEQQREQFVNDTNNTTATANVNADTTPAVQSADEAREHIESQPVEMKITTVQDMLNAEGWIADKGTVASRLSTEAPFLADSGYRQTVLNDLGLSKNDSNYAAIDEFVAKISEAANASGATVPELEALRIAAQENSTASQEQAQGTRQSTEAIRENEQAVKGEKSAHDENTNSIRDEQQQRQGNNLSGAAGTPNTVDNSPGLRERFKGYTKWKTNEEGKQTGRMAVSLGANIAKMIAPAIIAAAPNFAAKNNEEIQNRGVEGDKIAAGIGQGLSGAATGVQMGMAFGPLGAIIGGVAGFAITGLGSIFDGINYTLEEKYADSKKILEQAQQDNQKQQAKITELSSSIDNLKDLKKAMYESEESMQQYKEAMKSLAQQYPDLISGYDAAGNAIVSITEAEEKLANIRKQGAKAAANAAKQQVYTSEYAVKIANDAASASKWAKEGKEKNNKGQSTKYLKELQDYLKNNPELFGGQTDLAVIAGLNSGTSIDEIANDADALEQIETYFYDMWYDQLDELAVAKQEYKDAQRNQEFVNTVSNSKNLSASQKNEFESNSVYSKLYSTYREKTGKDADVSKQFMDKILRLTTAQRNKLTSVDYTSFTNMDQLLNYLGLGYLTGDDPLYKTLQQNLKDANQNRLDAIKNMVYESGDRSLGQINKQMTGLIKLEKLESERLQGTEEEVIDAKDIEWLFRTDTESGKSIISKYTDYFQDELVTINNLAEEGQTALAQTRLNYLDTMGIYLRRLDNEIQDDIFEIITSIDFSDTDSIEKGKEQLQTYAKENNLEEELADEIALLEEASENLISNIHTTMEGIIGNVKENTDKINKIIATNKSGMDLASAMEKYEELRLVNPDLNFDDLFEFDAVLQEYIYKRNGISTALEPYIKPYKDKAKDLEKNIGISNSLVKTLSETNDLEYVTDAFIADSDDNWERMEDLVELADLHQELADTDLYEILRNNYQGFKDNEQQFIEASDAWIIAYLQKLEEEGQEFDAEQFNWDYQDAIIEDDTFSFLGNQEDRENIASDIDDANSKYFYLQAEYAQKLGEIRKNGTEFNSKLLHHYKVMSDYFDQDQQHAAEWDAGVPQDVEAIFREEIKSFSGGKYDEWAIQDVMRRFHEAGGQNWIDFLNYIKENSTNGEYEQKLYEEYKDVWYGTTKQEIIYDSKEQFQSVIDGLLGLQGEEAELYQKLVDEFFTTKSDKTLTEFKRFVNEKAETNNTEYTRAKQILDNELLTERSTYANSIDWGAIAAGSDFTGRNNLSMYELADTFGLANQDLSGLEVTGSQAAWAARQQYASDWEFIYDNYLKSIYGKEIKENNKGTGIYTMDGVSKEKQEAYEAARAKFITDVQTSLSQQATTAINELLGGAGTKLSDTTRGLLKNTDLTKLDDQGLVAAGQDLVTNTALLYDRIKESFQTVSEANNAYSSILTKRYEQANQSITALSSGASLDISSLTTLFTTFNLELSDYMNAITGEWYEQYTLDEAGKGQFSLNGILETDAFGKTKIKNWDSFIEKTGIALDQEIRDSYEYQNAYSSYVDGMIAFDTQFQDLIKKSYDNAFSSITLFKEMNVSQLSEDIQDKLTKNGAATINNGILTVTNALEYATNAQEYFAELSLLSPKELYDQVGWSSADLAKNWKAAEVVLTQSKDSWTSVGQNIAQVSADQISTLIEKGGLKVDDIGIGKIFEPVGDHYVISLQNYALQLAKASVVHGEIKTDAYQKAMNAAQQAIFNNISGLDWTKVLDGTATNADLDTFKQGLVDNLTALGSSLGENYQEIIENVKSGELLNVTELVNALAGVDEALANHIKETIAEVQNNILSSISSASGYTYQGTNNISDMQKFVDEYNKLTGEAASIGDLFAYDTELDQFTLNADALKVYTEKQKEALEGLGMTGPAIEEYIKDQTETLIRQNMDITGFLNAEDSIERNKAGNSLKQQIINYLSLTGKGFQGTIEEEAEEYLRVLQLGGKRAVKKLKDLKGTELSQEEISVVYNAGINRINAAMEALEQGEGAILTGMAAEIAKTTAGITYTELVDGSVVIESVTSMAYAYAKLYNTMKKDSASTTASLNSLYAKFLTSIDQPETDAISVLNDAMGMSYEALGEMLAGYGKSLEEYITNANQYGLKSLGNGTVQIYDFDKFAKSMNWEPDSDAYKEARKSYNQSLIELDKKIGQNLTEEIKAITSAKAGDRIDLTYLSSRMNGNLLNELITNYGASFEKGILTIEAQTDVPGLITAIAQSAKQANELLPEELAELADAVSDYIKNIADLIKNGIGGTLSNVQAQELSAWAGIDLDFTNTAEGLKLSTDQAIQLYNKLKEVDGVKAKLVFDELNNSLKETNEHYKSISDIRARINEIESKPSEARTEALERELALAKEILAVRSTSEDESFNFMSNKIPGAQNNPLNYFSNWQTGWQALESSRKSGFMDYTQFYNLFTEMGNLAEKSGEIRIGAEKVLRNSDDAAKLIEDAASCLKVNSTTGQLEISLNDLSKLGYDFSVAGTNMDAGVTKGIQDFAHAQVTMLDGMIRLLEVIVQMENLGDITGENNTIDFTDFFKITGDETAGLNTANENVTKWVDGLLDLDDEESDLYKALEQIKINGQSLRTLLQSAKEGTINVKDAEALTSVLNSMWQMYQSGNWDLDNLYESLAQIAEESGLGGELTLNIDDTTLIISGGKITQIDWQDADTQAVLAEWKKMAGHTQESLIDAINKYNKGMALAPEDLVLVLKQQKILQIDDNNDVTVSINGKTQTFPGLDDTQKERLAKWVALEQAGIDIPDITIDLLNKAEAPSVEINQTGKLEYQVLYDDENGIQYKATLEDRTPIVGSSIEELAQAWIDWAETQSENQGKEYKLDEVMWAQFHQRAHIETIITDKQGNPINGVLSESNLREQVKKDLNNGDYSEAVLLDNGHYEFKIAGITMTLDGASVETNGKLDMGKVVSEANKQLLGIDLGLSESVTKGIEDAVPSIIKELNNLDAEAPQAVADALSSMLGTLQKLKEIGIDDIAEKFKKLGIPIEYSAEGVTEGVEEAKEKVNEAGEETGEEFTQGYKEQQEISSPAKTMIPYGEFTAAGVAEGIRSGSGEVYNATSELVTKAINGIISTVQNSNINRESGNTEIRITKSEPVNSDAINFGAMESALSEISSSINLTSSDISSHGSQTVSAFDALTSSAIELNNTSIVSNILNLSESTTSLKTAMYWLDYWANEAKDHIHTLGEYSGQAEWPIKYLGNDAETTRAEVTKLGEEAKEAYGHISKFGELTGGAEKAFAPLAKYATTAAESLGKIKIDITGLEGDEKLQDGKLEISIDQDKVKKEAKEAKATIDGIKQSKPVQVSVTDGGTVAAIQSAIDGIQGRDNVIVDVYEHYHPDPANPSSGAQGNNEARGNVGAMVARAKGTLMGELGPELVVSNGRYFVAGQNGAEFVNLNSDAIVFNHLQTRSLLENGMSKTRGKAVTNERSAVAFARGNVAGGPAKASASAALNALKQLRAQWKALESMSVKDLAGKGGGGGGGDPKAFLKDLERWYNWLQQIAQLEKEITHEETLRNRIASDYNKDGLKYYQSQRRSLRDLTEEIQTQKSLLSSQEDYFKKRQDELNKQSAFSALYKFSDSGQLYYEDGVYRDGKTAFEWLSDLAGRNSITGEANYTAKEQYDKLIAAGFGFAMEYDSSGNKIDKKTEGFENTAIQAFWDKIEADKSEMQSLHDSIEDLSNNIESNTQKQNEILKAIEDNQISVENRVLAAIEDSRQRAIEEQRKERDAIEKTNSDLIKGLSDALAKERELYNNSESDKELTSLQRQLSILRRSGGSAAEISSLQQEIASKQQDMYFDMQQQQIDALQEASDKQLERLDRQIELEEETLEYQKANGLLWDQVYEVMAGTPEEITQFIADNTSEYWSKSEVALGQEVRQVEFEAEQWKAFSKEGDITTLLGSIEDEVTRDTKEKQAKEEAARAATEAAAAQTTSSGSGSGNDNSSNGGGSDSYSTWQHDRTYHWKKKDKSDRAKHAFKNGKCTICGYSSLEYSKGPINDETANNIVSAAIKKEYTDNLSNDAVDSIKYKGKTANEIGIQKRKETLQSIVNTATLQSLLGGRASGGYVKNPSIGFLAEEGEEAVLTAEQTRILKNEILSNSPNSLLNLLQDFRAAYAEVGNTTNIANNAGSSVVIEHAEVNMRVDQLANGYDSARAADDVMKEMLNIARKTNAQNRVGR